MAFINPIKNLYAPRQDANGNALPSWATMGKINKDKSLKATYDEFMEGRKLWQQLPEDQQQAALQQMVADNAIPEGVNADIAGMNEYYQKSPIEDVALQGDKVWDSANRANSQGALKAWAGAHPIQIAGYGIGGGMNLAGLTDNDKFGGQILGAGLGAGLSAQGLGIAPWGAVPMAMAGGAIGSLFDKLRAKREQEEQYPQYR